MIGLSAWRPLRAATSGRFAAAYPDVATRLRIALAVVGAGVVVVAVFAPLLLRLGAIAAALVFVAERWRARPGWGSGRGLPPGSLGIFPDTWTNDRYLLEESQRHGPIFKASHFLRPQVCLVGLERGIELLKKHEQQLSIPPLPFADFVPGGLMRYMDDARHRHYRSIFRAAYSPAVFEPQLERFVETTREALAGIQDHSGAKSTGVVPLPFLDRLMMDLWFPLFFAIEPDSQKAAELRSLYPIIHINNPTGASPKRIREAVGRITEIVESQLAGWRDSTAAPCILGHIHSENEENASDPVVIGNLLYILHTSSTDISALLCWLLKMLSDHPQWLERLAQEPGPNLPVDASSLATRIVMETLRMRQSEFIYRAINEDFEFEGFRMPKGWLLRICVWESHRDAAVFDEPEVFDPDRFLGDSFTRSEYSPFGAQRHACLAPQLVMTVGSVFVRELARSFRLEATADGPIEVSSFRHWTPGAAYRIRLTGRA